MWSGGAENRPLTLQFMDNCSVNLKWKLWLVEQGKSAFQWSTLNLVIWSQMPCPFRKSRIIACSVLKEASLQWYICKTCMFSWKTKTCLRGPKIWSSGALFQQLCTTFYSLVYVSLRLNVSMSYNISIGCSNSYWFLYILYICIYICKICQNLKNMELSKFSYWMYPMKA